MPITQNMCFQNKSSQQEAKNDGILSSICISSLEPPPCVAHKIIYVNFWNS